MPPRTICCPSIRHEGCWYIIIGWHKHMPAGRPLHLRPLNRREPQLVAHYLSNFGGEAWTIIAAKDQRRTASTSR